MRTFRFIPAILLACFLSPAAFAQEIISGLKHRYSFGNAAGALADGSQVTDSISTAHGFIRGNGANASGTGVRLLGGSSATAAYIDFPNGIVSGSADLYPGYEEVTYEIWVTVHSSKNWSRIIDFGNNSIDEVSAPGGTFNGADYLCVSANMGTANDILFERGGQNLTGGGNQSLTGATTVGTPMHLVITYDTASFQWKLYKNGAQIGSVASVLGPSTVDDLNVWLGRSNWSGDSNADATFDEFRVYDRALSAQEVVNNYVAGPDTVTVTAPAVPAGLVATPGPNQVGLTWTASSGATKYYVKRATASGGPYGTIASPISANYLDIAVASGTTYYYIVTAVRSGVASTNSNVASATPLSVVKLTGTVIGSGGSWGGSSNTTDKVFDGNLATFYDAANASGDWAGLDLGSAQSVALLKYCPRPTFASRMVGGVIQASNSASFSSGVVTLYTIAAAPADGALTSQSVSGAGSYRYLRYLGPNNGYCNVAELEFYKSSAPASPPSGLTATPGNNQVGLSWNAVSGATSYKVKRSQVSGSGFSPIASGAASSYMDASVTNGITYYYVVSAENAGGESVDSAQTVATPLSPVQSWRQAYFGTNNNTGNAADGADPDADGLKNMIERALGTNPNAAGSGTATQLATALGKLAINFSRSTDATDMTFSVWGADDPGGPWTELARSTNGVPFAAIASGATVSETGSGATRAVQVSDMFLTNDPAHPRRFVRLQVLQP